MHAHANSHTHTHTHTHTHKQPDPVRGRTHDCMGRRRASHELRRHRDCGRGLSDVNRHEIRGRRVRLPHACTGGGGWPAGQFARAHAPLAGAGAVQSCDRGESAMPVMSRTESGVSVRTES